VKFMRVFQNVVQGGLVPFGVARPPHGSKEKLQGEPRPKIEDASP
jgi:hypothetical protein